MGTPAKLARMQNTTAYISELRAITGYYTGWVPQEYADVVSEEDAYEILKNDEAINSALDLFSLFVAGEYVRISGENKMLVDIATKAIGYIQDFTHARKSLAYNGYLFGLALQKKEWKKVTWRKFPGLVWEVPVSLQEVDRRRLQIERDPQNRACTYWTIWDWSKDQRIVMEDRNNVPDYEGPCVQDYLWYYHEVEELNPYYRGAGEVLFRLAYIKSKVIQYWARLCENWSQPYAVAMVDLMKGAFDANAGTGFQDVTTRMQNLIDIYEKMVSRHVMVLDKNGDDFKFFEHGSTGNNIVREFLEYSDKRIAHQILGAELTTDTGSGVGSYNMATIHRSATQSKVIYGRTRQEERIAEDIVDDFYWRNRHNLSSLGLYIPDPDEVQVEIRVRSEDIKEKILQQSSAKLSDAKQLETL